VHQLVIKGFSIVDARCNHEPSLLFSGYGGEGAKWPKREADHSPIFSTEVKNKWSHTPAPPYCYMADTGTISA